MQRTAPVHLLAAHSNPPPCDSTHTFSAILFSIGGFAGNFFHDVNDVLIPLFLTTGHLCSRAQLLVADFEPWWTQKYRHVLFHLSSTADLVVASSSSTPVKPKVHCFPAAVVGLKYHGNLLCNSSDAPGGVSILDFRRFLHGALGLKEERAAGPERPVLVLISRRTSRALLNEDGVVSLAREETAGDGETAREERREMARRPAREERPETASGRRSTREERRPAREERRFTPRMGEGEGEGEGEGRTRRKLGQASS